MDSTFTALNPLALAHALPFLPLAQQTVDQQVERRTDPQLLEELKSDSHTRAVLVCGEHVAVPLEQAARAGFQETQLRLASLPLSYVASVIEHPRVHWIYLGVEYAAAAGDTSADVAYLAVDVTAIFSAHQTSRGAQLQRRSSVQALPSPVSQHEASPAQQTALLNALAYRYGWVSLKQFAPRTSARDAGLATTAVSVAQWHARAQYCHYCGARLQVVHAGWVHACTQCGDSPAATSQDNVNQSYNPQSSITRSNTEQPDSAESSSRQLTAMHGENFESVSNQGVKANDKAKAKAKAIDKANKNANNNQSVAANVAANATANADLRQPLPQLQHPQPFQTQQLSHQTQVPLHPQSQSQSRPRLIFPRIEPAVITSIIDSQQRILLQHNAAWRENFYSVSAGFVEAGENLEHAARREAFEETGIELGALQYLGSQPWPFPSSLMVAFAGAARTTDIHVDGKETESARWFTRDELLHEVVAGRVLLPGKAAIARYMIEQWYGGELPHV